jgi:hypothetical protein
MHYLYFVGVKNLRLIKIPLGVTGLITVGTDEQSLKIAAWNWSRTDCLSATIK